MPIFILIVNMLSEWLMILECCGSNVASLLLAEIKFKNGSYVQKLLDAICLPAALAIIKIPGHCKLSLWKLRGLTLLIFPQGILSFKELSVAKPPKGYFPK